MISGWQGDGFSGAKLILLGPDLSLLTYLRDDFSHIPWPGHWDLPGGGREAGEAPEVTALRELQEEFGLRLGPERLLWHHLRKHDDASRLPGHYFGGRLSAAEISAIRFGSEGQFWRMRSVADYAADARTIPHMARLAEAFLGLCLAGEDQRVGTGLSPR